MMAQPIQMRHDVQNSLWYEVSPASDAMQIVETIPVKYRKQARDIIINLGDKLNISSDGKVIYDTDTVSDSYFRDMLLWHLDNEKYPKTYDTDRFLQLINSSDKNYAKPVLKWKSLY